MKPITKKQIRIIKIAQRQLGIDDFDYRQMLHNHFRVRSCTRLNSLQAKELIDLLKKKGFRVKKQRSGETGKRRNGDAGKQRKENKSLPRRHGNMVRMVSPAELAKIEVLSGLVHWRVKDGFTHWLCKRFSIERVKTAQEAYRVIEGLKKMFENQMKASYGERWWRRYFDDEQIMRYIEEHGSDKKMFG